MGELRKRPHDEGRAPLAPRPATPAAVLRLIARRALNFGVAWLILSLIWRAGAALVPFAIGLLLAYLLLPVVTRLDRYLPRWASILVVYVVGLALLVWSLRVLAPTIGQQVDQAVQNVPRWYAQAEHLVDRGVAAFQQAAPLQVQAYIDQQVQEVQDALQRNATVYVQRAGMLLLSSILALLQTLTFMLGFVVIPVFLFFVLASTDHLPAAINQMLHPAIRQDFWNIWKIVDRIFGSYVRSQLVLGLIVGVVTFVGLSALSLVGIQVPYIALLAIIAGFGELIPVIGPILSAVPALIVVSGDGLSVVLSIVALYVVIQQIESQILVPRIVGTRIWVNPAMLLLVVVLAAATGGLLLAIVSAHLAAIGRDLVIYLHRRLREPPLPPSIALKGLLADASE